VPLYALSIAKDTPNLYERLPPLPPPPTFWNHFFFTRATRATVDQFWSWSPPSTTSSIIIIIKSLGSLPAEYYGKAKLSQPYIFKKERYIIHGTRIF
jgi:hypothetical protein